MIAALLAESSTPATLNRKRTTPPNAALAIPASPTPIPAPQIGIPITGTRNIINPIAPNITEHKPNPTGGKCARSSIVPVDSWWGFVTKSYRCQGATRGKFSVRAHAGTKNASHNR